MTTKRAVAAGRPAVAITGIGAVCGFGYGVDALLAGLRAGRPAIAEIDLFPVDAHRTRLGSQVRASAPARLDRGLSRGDRFAVCAAREAVARAGLDARTLADAGVFFGSSNGGLLEGERFLRRLRAGASLGLRAVASHQNNGPGDAVAHDLAVQGPVVTSSSACTSANMALAAALDALRAGECEVAIAGGADAMCETTYAGFNSLRAVDPAPAQPFRRARAGLSMGEGAGVVVLETLAHARARGATVLAELVGAGASCDAHHMSAPRDDGSGSLAAMERALRDAGESPAAIDFVNAHGTGTPHNDVAEAHALRTLLGEAAARVPITSTKSLLGHLLGGCGGLEAVVCVLGLTWGEVHATAGEGPADPEFGLDLVHGSTRALTRARLALSNNLAFGGNNCTVLLRRPQP